MLSMLGKTTWRLKTTHCDHIKTHTTLQGTNIPYPTKRVPAGKSSTQKCQRVGGYMIVPRRVSSYITQTPYRPHSSDGEKPVPGSWQFPVRNPYPACDQPGSVLQKCCESKKNQRMGFLAAKFQETRQWNVPSIF